MARSRRRPGLVRFAHAAVVAAVITGAAGSAWAYDGSILAYQNHVERYRLDWPVPQQMDWFSASDGARLRYARFAVPAGVSPRGVVVFFSGRADFIEKNVPAYTALLRRGFGVWVLDWRGQGFSDRTVVSPDGQDKGDIASFDSYLRDADEFIEQVVKLRSAAGAKVLVGHSMGGQLALRYLIEHPDAFDRAVLTAPLLQIPKDNPSLPWLRWGNALKDLVGLSTSCVKGGAPRWTSHFRGPACHLLPGSPDALAQELVDPRVSGRYTHDWPLLAQRICVIEESRGRAPNLGVACPTSRWLAAALRSTDITMAARHRLRTPTLMVAAANDQVVSNAGQIAFCDDANPACCRAREIEGAGHELLLEREPITTAVFALIDRFLRTSLSPKAFCSTS